MEHLTNSKMRKELDFRNALRSLIPPIKWATKWTSRTTNLVKFLLVVAFVSALFTYGVSHWLLFITGAYSHGTTVTILSAKHLNK